MVKNYYKVKNYDAKRSIGYLLRRAGKLVTLHIEGLFEGQEITATQWIVMMNLHAGILKTAAEICQTLVHDSGALTRMLDQMEEAGLITRARSTEDRRVVELSLTAKGNEVTEQYLPQLVELYNHLFEDFSKDEADVLIDLLVRLNHKLGGQKGKA